MTMIPIAATIQATIGHEHNDESGMKCFTETVDLVDFVLDRFVYNWIDNLISLDLCGFGKDAETSFCAVRWQ